MLVVTDDRDLRHGLQLRGARTARTSWLLGRLDRTNRRVVRGRGRPAPPSRTGPGDDGDGDDDGPRWEPGRGATVKKGNPRRAPRSDRG